MSDLRRRLVIKLLLGALPLWSVDAASSSSSSSSTVATLSTATIPGAASFRVPAGFPTSLYSSYYVQAGATVEPQPIIYDEVLSTTYPFNLTNPKSIPTTVTDPVYLPTPTRSLDGASQTQVLSSARKAFSSILAQPTSVSNCTKCVQGLQIGASVAQQVPAQLPALLVELCQTTGFQSNSSCQTTYGIQNQGQIWTQILAYANVTGLDGQYICNSLSSTFCPLPGVLPLNVTGLFPKPKPKTPRVHRPSGKRVKVLHISDLHLDPRYAPGSEANCTSGLCCRTNTNNKNVAVGQTSLAAPLYGTFTCDSPYDLITSAMQSIGPLTGFTDKDPIGWTIYTGDLVSHDPGNEIDRAYVDYTEKVLYSLLRDYTKAPVYAALGNHDTTPVNIDTPHSLPGTLKDQFSWNYDHVARLWKSNHWLDQIAVDEARSHYGAFSVKNHIGVRVISINTDFWYRSNVANFINITNPDVSGTLRFVIQELQKAEDCGERVWIIGHVLAGWDGTAGLAPQTNLFYQIVDRYSNTIAGVFFGHSHEDENFIYYANNGTVRNANTAQVPAFVGPSVTPLTNLNSGFRLYEVDTGSFEVLDSYTFVANVSTFSTLNVSATGPTYYLEYSARHAYPIGWPTNAPLNATFWHGVTQLMERDHSYVALQNRYQGKSSVLSPNCTSDDCVAARICYMRSGSVPLARQCLAGFGSVQGKSS